MAMPKGFKSDNGYATIADLGGQSYHDIAEAMSARGFKMNHSTSRNRPYFLLEKPGKEYDSRPSVYAECL